MRKEYESPKYEFVVFEDADVFTTGSCDNDTYYEGVNTFASGNCDYGNNCD